MDNPWNTVRLGDVAVKIGSGATPRGGGETYLANGPIALIRSQNIYNDRFSRDGLAYISEAQADLLGNVIVEPGDVLLNITGNSVSRCTQVDRSILPARVNQHVAIIRPDTSRLDPRFLHYYLVSPAMQGYLHKLAAAGATRPALTKAMIESLPITAPASIADQRRISDILGVLDDKIALARKTLLTLDAMSRALLKSWFVDFDPVRAKADGGSVGLAPDIAALFPAHFADSELGLVPAGWAAPRLSEVLEESSERIGSNVAPEYSSTNDGLHPRSERFSKSLAASSAKNKLIRFGFMVFGLSRSVLNFGLMRDEVGSVSSAYRVYKVDETQIAPDLLERLMRLNSMYYYNAVSASSREGQSISTNGLGLLRFVSPPRPVQDAFYSIDCTFRGKMERLAIECRVLSALRDALLPGLIGGDIQPRDEQTLEKAT